MKSQEDLDAEVEALDESIHEMTTEELEEAHTRLVKGNSAEAFALRTARKKVRYRLYRIQRMVLGGPDAQDVDDLKGKFEAMPLFNNGDWRWFGENWDVALDDPYQIIQRTHSTAEEWEEIIRTKYPVLGDNGQVTYPDITVKERVEKNAREEAERN